MNRRCFCGWRGTEMATKQEVIELHRKNPQMTSKQIAAVILGGGASDYERLVNTNGWVRATGQRNGLNFAKVPRTRKPKPPPKPRRDALMALGRACREAGFTVADIREIAEID